MNQLNLFAKSDPEVKIQLVAFGILIGNLIETLKQNGCLAKDQATTLFYHSDLKSALMIWDNLKGSMSNAELERMDQHATLFLAKLQNNFSC